MEMNLRPTRRVDAAAVVDLANAYSLALVGEAEETVETTLTGWDTPGLNLETDSVVVELPGGRLVATAELWDLQDLHVRANGYWRVHPDFQRQGIEEQLAEWLETRARCSVTLAPPQARVTLVVRFADLDRTADRVLSARGFAVVRQLVRMETGLNGGSVHSAPSLSGLAIVPMDEERKPAAVRALYEAFRDHWGMVPETLEQYSRRVLHIFDYPEISLPHSLVALEGEEVVAAAICSDSTVNDPHMGWVNLLGVRRAWRKRGIGEAMLHRAFAGFQAAGLERAGLHVDAESLTGATRLYEKVGMRVTHRYLTYEKELRPGEDLTVRTVAG